MFGTFLRAWDISFLGFEDLKKLKDSSRDLKARVKLGALVKAVVIKLSDTGHGADVNAMALLMSAANTKTVEVVEGIITEVELAMKDAGKSSLDFKFDDYHLKYHVRVLSQLAIKRNPRAISVLVMALLEDLVWGDVLDEAVHAVQVGSPAAEGNERANEIAIHGLERKSWALVRMLSHHSPEKRHPTTVFRALELVSRALGGGILLSGFLERAKWVNTLPRYAGVGVRESLISEATGYVGFASLEQVIAAIGTKSASLVTKLLGVEKDAAALTSVIRVLKEVEGKLGDKIAYDQVHPFPNWPRVKVRAALKSVTGALQVVGNQFSVKGLGLGANEIIQELMLPSRSFRVRVGRGATAGGLGEGKSGWGWVGWGKEVTRSGEKSAATHAKKPRTNSDFEIVCKCLLF